MPWGRRQGAAGPWNPPTPGVRRAGRWRERGKEVIFTKSYLPGGAALCRRSVYPCPVGVDFDFQKLSSRVGESQIFQIEGLRQPRRAQMGFRHLFRRSPELSGGGVLSSAGPSGAAFGSLRGFRLMLFCSFHVFSVPGFPFAVSEKLPGLLRGPGVGDFE